MRPRWNETIPPTYRFGVTFGVTAGAILLRTILDVPFFPVLLGALVVALVLMLIGTRIYRSNPRERR